MGTPLTSVNGIGPAAAAVLAEHGIASAEQLAACVVDTLVKVPGFGPARATATLRAARSLVEGQAGTAAAEAGGMGRKAGKKPKDGKGGKKAKGKKDKKKRKKEPRKEKKRKGKKGGKARKGGKRKKK